MPIGKIKDRNSDKNQNFEIIEDDVVRQAANIIGDKINQREKDKVWWYYHSKEMREVMKEEKRNNMAKPKTIRRSMTIPVPVKLFLDAYFEPEHGEKWIENKKLWSHELLRPWLLVDWNG